MENDWAEKKEICFQVPLGIEPRLPESESGVITVTLRDPLVEDNLAWKSYDENRPPCIGLLWAYPRPHPTHFRLEGQSDRISLIV